MAVGEGESSSKTKQGRGCVKAVVKQRPKPMGALAMKIEALTLKIAHILV